MFEASYTQAVAHGTGASEELGGHSVVRIVSTCRTPIVQMLRLLLVWLFTDSPTRNVFDKPSLIAAAVRWLR